MMHNIKHMTDITNKVYLLNTMKTAFLNKLFTPYKQWHSWYREHVTNASTALQRQIFKTVQLGHSAK